MVQVFVYTDCTVIECTISQRTGAMEWGKLCSSLFHVCLITATEEKEVGIWEELASQCRRDAGDFLSSPQCGLFLFLGNLGKAQPRRTLESLNISVSYIVYASKWKNKKDKLDWPIRFHPLSSLIFCSSHPFSVIHSQRRLNITKLQSTYLGMREKFSLVCI